ncbi:hypothetical protein JI752_000040 [Lysobacter sp. MMG2]|uniref:hypothetical protein n=1 Tax=Lysobacter sp. MMG2 TaxID=2801338 RepID=UPI001C241BC8|nr:hypothetical protein [Lysobacter sp. MMG2]MBU8974518.1 hypothetical protein [Lysobacter sp. MMG2]
MLDALEALAQPQGFIYQDEIPGEHYEAFWTFTGAQTVFKGPDGRPAIPGSAWLEYVAWLREAQADPSAVTSTTKFEWRQRTGRWI